MDIYCVEKSKEYNEKLREYIPGGVHTNYSAIIKFPSEVGTLHFNKADKSRIWDLDGNEYLDMAAKYGAMIIGHNHPQYITELEKKIEQGACFNHSDVEISICQRIQECMPSMERIRFCLSGTEAVQNALRVSRAYTGKKKFVRFEGNYHGNMDNIIGGKVENSECPIPVENSKGRGCTLGRFPGILEEQSFLLPWNDIEAIENVITRYGDEIAAVITEAISINGGGIEPKEGYLERLRKLCDEHNIVLIFDEVITGFRVSLGGAQGKLKVRPDLTIMGKSISGGDLPLSVFGGRQDIMKLYEDYKVIHGGTFNGYSLGLTSAYATLSILKEEDYMSMEKYAKKIYEIFLKDAHEEGIDMVIQGPLTCGTFHCTDKPIHKFEQMTYRTSLKEHFVSESFAQYGVLFSSTNRMFTNIMLGQEDVDFFAERSKAAMSLAKQKIVSIFGER